MTAEPQILFPISILVSRRCDLDKSVSDTTYLKTNWIFPASLKSQMWSEQVQTLTCTNTNPHTPRTHTDTPRLSLAKPLL